MIGFGCALVLLSFASVASYLDARRLADATAQVDDTHDVIERLDSVSITVERIVTTARIFVLTGEETFLAPLTQLQAQLAQDFSVLSALLADSDQLTNVATLEALVGRRVALSDDYIDLRRRLGLQQATDEIPPGGERLATEIRDTIGNIEQTLRLRLEQRRDAAAVSHATTRAAISFLGVASVIALLAAFVAFRKQAAERVELERQIVATGERERDRIARDLHDGLGQELTGISLRLAALSKLLERERSNHLSTVQSLQALTQTSISESRRLSRSLSPGVGHNSGICAALSSLAREVNELSEVSCTANCSTEDDISDDEIVTQLFRIAQEATNNALKHSNARNIELHYGRDRGKVYLAVLDDGVGMPSERDRVDGLGLRSMRYRAQMIRGRLDARARVDGGTEVRCSFVAP